MRHVDSREAGAVNPLLIASILLALLSAGLAGFGIWSFGNYMDQKDNTDAKIATAVTNAKKTQESDLEKDFVEREKKPNLQFAGPDDLGHVTFDYPKTWSVYVASNGVTDDYEAYLNPVSVPTVTETQPFALRVEVLRKTYDDVLKTYESAVKKGDLKSAPITVNGFTGVRLDGNFSKERQGSSIVFKIRDKALVISTDATTFKNDFDNTIITSLDFNP